MKIEHIAIWTKNTELLRDYYVTYFDGMSNQKYINTKTGFESYFISFDSSARLEIMSMPEIPENKNDTINKQYIGFIHLAFGLDTIQLVDEKWKQLKESGFKILSAPRKTGDGYYEFVTLDPDNNRIEVTTKLSNTNNKEI